MNFSHLGDLLNILCEAFQLLCRNRFISACTIWNGFHIEIKIILKFLVLEKRWGFGPLKGAPRVRRRRNFRIIRLRMYRNRISARLRHLRILQRQRRRRLLLVNFRVKLRHCHRRYNIRRRNWQNRVFWSMMRGRANFAVSIFLRFSFCFIHQLCVLSPVLSEKFIVLHYLL